MTQYQLDQAIARATGESLATIRSHGFSPLYIPQVAYGPEDGGSQIRVADTKSHQTRQVVGRQHRHAA